MKGIKKVAKTIIVKYGAIIASFAFAVVSIAGNSSCCFAFYEPEEPAGLCKFKKFDK